MLQLERRHQLLLLMVAAVILMGMGYKLAMLRSGEAAGAPPLVTDQQETAGGQAVTRDAPDGEIVVHVAGAVQKPGVYRLPPGSRVVDAVNMAGPGEDAALDRLNLAAPLEDGKQVMIYSRSETAGPPGTGPGVEVTGSMPAAGAAPGAVMININTAGQAELEELPGIGPSLAQRIMDYRTQNGPFLTIEDIMNVSGIGEKRFEQLKNSICVN